MPCEVDSPLELPAAHFGIDAETTWLPNEGFLGLLSVEQLVELARNAEIFGAGRPGRTAN